MTLYEHENIFYRMKGKLRQNKADNQNKNLDKADFRILTGKIKVNNFHRNLK